MDNVSQSRLRRTKSHEMLSDRTILWSHKFGKLYISFPLETNSTQSHIKAFRSPGVKTSIMVDPTSSPQIAIPPFLPSELRDNGPGLRGRIAVFLCQVTGLVVFFATKQSI